MKPVVAIIGAGPAGLTAALELIRDGRMTPIVFETSNQVGGISRTVEYKGNRMDIGGHRFFSKSDWVMNWWRDILPIAADESAVEIVYHGQRRTVDTDRATPAEDGLTMLVRKRVSRIYFLRKYFDYPITLNRTTLTNLGAVRLLRIGFSYLWATLFPRRNMRSLEDFLVNRFGEELYRTFFKDYTEKVWGVPCSQISAEWGAQRIKGVSVIEAIKHALRKGRSNRDTATKTSLIDHFLYPRLGPGQLWQEVARRVSEGGGEIHFSCQIEGLQHQSGKVKALRVRSAAGQIQEVEADYVISTMAVKDLVSGMQPPAPSAVREIADALPYRDFITVGLLVSRMRANPQSLSNRADNMPPDNWIYIQERDVRVGRLQVFNNWSPDLVEREDRIWLGLEYFCQEGDDLWTLPDDKMIAFAADELAKLDMIDHTDVLEGTVVRVPKTYPAYFGTYADFPVVRQWLDGLENLYLVGRNGMHRYNNQDHSMLTAKLAVEAILDGKVDKAQIWAVNIDDDYHEERGKASIGK
ncbi:MAG: protoporphyrinogen oxidase [Candidatus Accumulibacter regalis]|uniref:Protoporphyrinogen oxidase n=1 Tax=Accumulibacter regalis TaxID=522306 RepID=A0A011PJ70_ACCRE|nr:NAD(P)/FAD-dependent oxidoreductase [Accumulibacter sp.]EXI87561.1 MAG: protoporphyrinogen oxidase [Candidatus Accumulibacter regalis]HRE69589.1 NAD(P)/FAD-dependent oxidoreductase [Accumulibacter sp.]